jgi:asparagine synthase (glutamine-hydrolysing)
MREGIRHRGPDGNGTYSAAGVTLFHTRLAILDLSANGHQPMLTPDGRYALIFNGELYNHRELRTELEAMGYQFRSSADTETLLYGFAAWGAAIFERLNGIFACAFFDTVTRQLTLARDQFGVKPLYYYHRDGLLLFASELKVIAAYPGVDRTLAPEALTTYLHYLYAPGEQTPFRYVRKLLPGYTLRFCPDEPTTLQCQRFYTVPFVGQYENRSEADLLDELDNRLRMAVERQLQSDVPLGFFLSGGLDSSAVAAMARKLYPRDTLTGYTIRTAANHRSYEGFSNDLPYARQVAHYLNIKLVEVAAEDAIVQDFDRVVYHLDEPIADTAPINVLNICREARRNGHTVLLGGTAGDDVFSGYRRHQALTLEPLFGKIPQGLGQWLHQISYRVLPTQSVGRRLQKLTAGLGLSSVNRMADYYGWLPNELNRQLFAPSIRADLPSQHPRQALIEMLSLIPNETSRLNQMLFWEMNAYLPDHNLMYTDKLSMAVGVEARVPFLDLDLVQFSTTIPPTLKMRGTTTKYLLRKLMEQYLPNNVIYRSKTGFGTPLRGWFQSGRLDNLLQTYLTEESIRQRGLFDPAAVRQLIQQNQTGKLDVSYTLWGLMAIESWCRQFVDQPAVQIQQHNHTIKL